MTSNGSNGRGNDPNVLNCKGRACEWFLSHYLWESDLYINTHLSFLTCGEERTQRKLIAAKEEKIRFQLIRPPAYAL
jgi:hypothetical protein